MSLNQKNLSLSPCSLLRNNESSEDEFSSDHQRLENLRLSELGRYRLQNGPQEPALSRLANLAATITGTPLAIISFACGEDMLLHGLSGVSDSLIQTVGGKGTCHGLWSVPRVTSFCECVVSSDAFVEFPNLCLDERVLHYPGVPAADSCEAGLRFYAGAPLRSDSGLAIGVIAVLDFEPRQLSAAQREALHELAACVMDALEARVARLLSAQLRGAREDERQKQLEEFQVRLLHLMRQNSQFKAAVFHSSVGITITDAEMPDHPIIYTNSAFEQITGYSREEIIGFNCRFLRGPSTIPKPPLRCAGPFSRINLFMARW